MLVKRAGPRPSGNLVNSLLAVGRKDNTGKPVVLLGGGATCGNANGWKHGCLLLPIRRGRSIESEWTGGVHAGGIEGAAHGVVHHRRQ